MRVPVYLREWAVDEKQTGTHLGFHIQCPCGCRRFFLYRSEDTPEVKRALKAHRKAWQELLMDADGISSSKDTHGQWHNYKILPSGETAECVLPPAPAVVSVEAWKAVCAVCGAEKVLFDSRFHGYDAVVSATSVDAAEPSYRLRETRDRQPQRLYIQVENEASLEEFQESSGYSCNEETYASAFSWFSLYAINSVGVKRRIFDCETA